MDKTIFIEQLHKAFAQIGISNHGKNTQIAKLMGVTRAAVGKWFDPTEPTLPKHELLIKISDVTGMSIDALLRGEAYDALSSLKIPVLSAHQILNFNGLNDAEKFANVMPSLTKLGAAFATKVIDDSMISANQSFPVGCYIVFEKTKSVKNGDLVYAKIGNEGLFRKYIEGAGKQYLMPLNPTYENDKGAFEVLGLYRYAVLDFKL